MPRLKSTRLKKKDITAAEQRLKEIARDHPSLVDEIERLRALVVPTGPRLAPTPAWDTAWRTKPSEQLELPETLDAEIRA